MPEGDTIAWAAHRIRPVLEGRVPDEILTPQRRHARDDWPQRLAGREVTRVDTHGKHLFLHFAGGLVIHSHLRMTGSWGVYTDRGGGQPASDPPAPGGAVVDGRRSRARAWLVLRCGGHEVVQFGGPVLELMTETRRRFDQRLAALGPDVLASEFDSVTFLGRLRADDPTRPFGDALLDQRNVAGIGNLWKAEGCWEAQIDPWRRVKEVSSTQAVAVINAVRPRMSLSGREGPRTIHPRVYGRGGMPCPRCGARIRARGQGDDNRTTYWCPACQA